VDDVHFDGDPATDSTRRRLERVLKEETSPRWPWFAAFAAGGTALLFWQIRKRRRNGNGSSSTSTRNRQGSQS
jgi:hypothetical protein